MDARRRVVISCGIVAIATAAMAQTPGDDRAPIAARAAERIRALQREADRLAGESRTLLGDLRRLEIERQISVETVRASEANVQEVTTALDAARARVAALEARRNEATPALVAELVEIYKRGRRRHAQVLLASVADSRALGRLIRGAQGLARIEHARIEAHRRALRVEQEAVRELERQADAAVRSRRAHLAARAALDRSIAEQNRLIEAIDRDRDVAARYAGELQSARGDLERALARPDAAPSADPLPIAPFKGDLDWPVRGVVRSRFNPAANRSAPAGVRNGIEFVATERSSVTAIHGGRVTFAGPFFGRGALVAVDHGNGVHSLYGYLAEILVDVGREVDRGSLIGRVGAAGLVRSGEPTLYFELRVDGRPVDPLQWLRSTP